MPFEFSWVTISENVRRTYSCLWVCEWVWTPKRASHAFDT